MYDYASVGLAPWRALKNIKYGLMALLLFVLFFATSCSIQTDDLEGATIYTTVYPINFLTEYLYHFFVFNKSVNSCSEYSMLCLIMPVLQNM